MDVMILLVTLVQELLIHMDMILMVLEHIQFLALLVQLEEVYSLLLVLEFVEFLVVQIVLH